MLVNQISFTRMCVHSVGTKLYIMNADGTNVGCLQCGYGTFAVLSTPRAVADRLIFTSNLDGNFAEIDLPDFELYSIAPQFNRTPTRLTKNTIFDAPSFAGFFY